MSNTLYKRILTAIVSIAVLLSSLTACGSTSTSTESAEETSAVLESSTNSSAEEESDEIQDDSADGSDGTETSNDAEAEADLASEQVLNILLGETINTLDANAQSWTGEAQVVVETQEALLRILTDESGTDTIVCAGAESYTVSDDGLVYTFYLRDNYWSDGEPVVAQHYVDAFFRNLDPSNGFDTSGFTLVKNAEAYYNGECEASEVGIVALDEKTVQYTLESPDTEFPYYLTSRPGYPARLDVIEAASSTYGTDISEMVFSGPFVVSNWVKQNSITLTKNPYYWDAENVLLETVNMQLVAEESTQATLFNAQQLDIVEYNDDYGESWLAAAEAGEITYISKVGNRSHFLVFAIENGGSSGLMGNAKIRLALSLAIDREEYVETVFGRYTAAYTFVPTAVTVNGVTYNTSGEGLVKEQQAQYSTDEALQALFQEGLDELGMDISLSEVNLDFLVQSGSVVDQTEMEYIAQVWESRLGIQVTRDVSTDAEERQNSLDYDVGVNNWTGGHSPYNYLYVVNVPYGLKYLTGVYTNEEVNTLLSTVASIADAEEQAQVYHEIENIILEEAGVGPLYFSDIQYFQQTYVQGVYYTTFGTAYDFSRAYIVAH